MQRFNAVYLLPSHTWIHILVVPHILPVLRRHEAGCPRWATSPLLGPVPPPRLFVFTHPFLLPFVIYCGLY